MNIRTTVADARKALYRIVNPSDRNDPQFLEALNEVCERFTYSGKWDGSIVQVDFASSLGFITLPQEYLSVVGCQFYNAPVATFTQFAEYCETGYGQIDETQGRTQALYDAGDGFCTQADLTVDSTLRIKTGTADDDGLVVRLFGEDADGKEIFSDGSRGVDLTLTFPSADTTQVFSKVTGIQSQPLSANWSLWGVASAVETQIGAYKPNEERPNYRRYKTGVTTEAIRVICHRRHILMTEETDWVIPGYTSVLRQGLEAVMQERQAADSNADNLWERGYMLLNQLAKSVRGSAQPTIAYDPWGDGRGLPSGN